METTMVAATAYDTMIKRQDIKDVMVATQQANYGSNRRSNHIRIHNSYVWEQIHFIHIFKRIKIGKVATEYNAALVQNLNFRINHMWHESAGRSAHTSTHRAADKEERLVENKSLPKNAHGIKKICKSSKKKDSSCQEMHIIKKSKKKKNDKKGIKKVTVSKKESVPVGDKKSNQKKRAVIDPRSKTHDSPCKKNGITCYFFRGGRCNREKDCRYTHEDPETSGESDVYESDYSQNYQKKFPPIGESSLSDGKAVRGSRQRGTKTILKNPKMRTSSRENDGKNKVENSKVSKTKKTLNQIENEGVSPPSVLGTKGVTKSRRKRANVVERVLVVVVVPFHVVVGVVDETRIDSLSQSPKMEGVREAEKKLLV